MKDSVILSSKVIVEEKNPGYSVRIIITDSAKVTLYFQFKKRVKMVEGYLKNIYPERNEISSFMAHEDIGRHNVISRLPKKRIDFLCKFFPELINQKTE
jgi:hypothetical protein